MMAARNGCQVPASTPTARDATATSAAKPVERARNCRRVVPAGDKFVRMRSSIARQMSSHALHLLYELSQPWVLSQFLDQFLHLLRLAFVGEQRRVIRLHQDRVAQANNRNGGAPIFRARVEDDIARAIQVDEFGQGAISLRIGFEM